MKVRIGYAILLLVFYTECTIIIIEDAKACFRRVLAGKRVARSFVKRSLLCERVEDCHRECSDERRFPCEGFNYRLDPTGRGKGECELLAIPLSRLDIARDIYPDPDYDYYERDRNAASTNCRKSNTHIPPSGDYYGYRYGGGNRGYFQDRSYVPARLLPPHPWEITHRHPQPPPAPPLQSWNRRGDFPHYLPPPPPPPTTINNKNYWNKNDYYLPPKVDRDHDGWFGTNRYLPHDNSILPLEHRKPINLKNECSLRMAAGFKLHKSVVRKYFTVNDIYECENLCVKERQCNSYAYRYTTVSVAAPTDNCYLSDRTFKQLDYYVDLEPDRDFDVYTINNRDECPVFDFNNNNRVDYDRKRSDCFWRVRSGQRFDQKIVGDSLTTKSIVECQLECLKSRRCTCRSYSYRYGPPGGSGIIDNCQLTDWPFSELNPRLHFVPEEGFEIYERGSFGHGCELDHFDFPRQPPHKTPDQLCYIGFGSPARLLPQATKKAIHVRSELDCKLECSKSRKSTLFQCMSFSYKNSGPKSHPNCLLSDIYQRDLLPHLDYVYDPDSWLFAYDNFNPECVALLNENHGNINRYDNFQALDTWKVYSVSGWPCKYGTFCKENKDAGFWFCELEGGGTRDAWDYCCRPNHQCGASHNYPYQWCYVGPERTQWRKCSDRYFPYIHNIIDRLDHKKPPYLPGFRPDRPQAPPLEPPIRPSLDEYESIFDNEFLAPPKPGGFGQPRHWPVSYLHKDPPPDISVNDSSVMMRMEEDATDPTSKYVAIQSLIDVIKKNDLNDVEFGIANKTSTENDVLYVKIPLPTNFTKESRDDNNNNNRTVERSQKSVGLMNSNGKSATYRRGYVTRTNVTSPVKIRV